MAGRPLMVATLLGASIGVPYVVSQTSQSAKSGTSPAPAATTAPNWRYSSSTLSGTSAPAAFAPLVAGTTMAAAPTPIEGNRYHSIQQVFRFDVTREWVYQNWGRKSTGLGDPSLYGIRVALVTGTGFTDLAGALTYQFNAQGQVEHISFRGRTADTTAIVQYLVQTYKFQRMDAPAGEQLYQVRSGHDVYSELRSRPESVLNADLPHGSFGVVIELGRPGLNRPLVPQTPKLNVPPAAAPPPTAAAANSADSSAKSGEAASAEPALIGKMRPATPNEESQLHRMRWPN